MAAPEDERGRRLITHPDVTAVVLTGSTATAELFTSWRPELRLHAETSGKNAIVVSATADVDQAVANIVASMEMGVATFDSSVAGLGGCPYAKGATGNVASEDVLYMLNGLGIETGIDMDKLLDAAEFICTQLKRPTVSRAGRAAIAKAVERFEHFLGMPVQVS